MRALWGVGEKSRHIAFGVVALAWLFDILLVGVANGIHKDFVAPTPVYTSGLLIYVIHC